MLPCCPYCTVQDLVRSSVAARVNGYLGGYGDRASFLAERDTLGLSEETGEWLAEQLSVMKT